MGKVRYCKECGKDVLHNLKRDDYYFIIKCCKCNNVVEKLLNKSKKTLLRERTK